QSDSLQPGMSYAGGRRSWIKCDPAAVRKIRLHPCVCVFGANYVLGSDIIEFARLKASDHARRNRNYPQHDRHGGIKVFAMPTFSGEEKIRQWVRGPAAGKLQRVAETAGQIGPYCIGFVVVTDAVGCDLAGKLRNSRIEMRWQLQIN